MQSSFEDFYGNRNDSFHLTAQWFVKYFINNWRAEISKLFKTCAQCESKRSMFVILKGQLGYVRYTCMCTQLRNRIVYNFGSTVHEMKRVKTNWARSWVYSLSVILVNFFLLVDFSKSFWKSRTIQYVRIINWHKYRGCLVCLYESPESSIEITIFEIFI